MGWGSFGAGDDPGGPKLFTLSIGWNAGNGQDLKLVAVDDPVRFIICGDKGHEQGNMTPGSTAYPDICMLDCAICGAICPDGGDCWWDWSDAWGSGEPCADEAGCTPMVAYPAMVTDVSLRKPYSRHLGGVNLGFLDGHAAWWNSERLLATIREGQGSDTMGLSVPWAPVSWCVLEGTGTQNPTLY